VEAWNFTKNKLLKLVNAMKKERLSICQLKSEHNYSEKSIRKMHPLLMMF